MKRLAIAAAIGAITATTIVALGQPGAPSGDKPSGHTSPSADQVAAGKRAFADVAKVLLSPRCKNCHPKGDRPLQGDAGKPHIQNISRKSVEAGVLCTTCHQTRNSEDTVGVAGGPPGAPHWGLPPAVEVFEGRTPAELCRQLNDPRKTGGRDLDKLLEHVSTDPLVLWGWKPGGKRTPPPISHERFVASFKTWVASNGACP